jgi:hypothetical protein
VDTRQDDDSLLLRHVEEPIWEPNEQGAPRPMKNDRKHVRVGPDETDGLTHRGPKLCAKPWTLCLIPKLCGRKIKFCLRPNDDGQGQVRRSSLARTSSQGDPALGFSL